MAGVSAPARSDECPVEGRAQVALGEYHRGRPAVVARQPRARRTGAHRFRFPSGPAGQPGTMTTENRTPDDPPAAGSTPRQPHTQVTPEDLRRLLDAENAQATLALAGGAVRVETDPDVAAQGLPVITRAALVDRIGADPDDNALTVQAAELETEIRLLGA